MFSLINKFFFHSFFIFFLIFINLFIISSQIKNSFINLIPFLEYAQNNTHIFIHIINKQSLPIKNLSVILTKLKISLSYELLKENFNENENLIYYFKREISLFSLSKNETLFIKKENELNYIIYFEKFIATFYWSFLDQEVDDHQNILTWFDLYEKYEKKSHFNSYKDFVESNMIIEKYKNILKERNEDNKNKENGMSKKEKEKRKNKIKKMEDNFENSLINYYKNKNNCRNLPKIKKCFINDEDDIFDWNFWIS